MLITHEETRRLIQLDSDDGLKPTQKSMLESHLERCPECLRYSESIEEMEAALRPLLQRQWNQQPIPLSITSLQPKGGFSGSEGMMLATRIAAVGIVFITFMFSAWQLSASRHGASGPALSNGPAIPPIVFTLTEPPTATTDVEVCSESLYVVQKNDTLDSIAFQFSVDKVEILERNGLSTEVLIAGTPLIIPVCASAPTSTVNAQATTFTPMIHMLTSTPAGY